MKNLIFDLGAVLVEWNPAAIAAGFSPDQKLQQRIINDIYFHRVWADFDLGLTDEAETQQRMSEVLSIEQHQAASLIEQTQQSLQLIPRSLEKLKQCKALQLPVYCLSNISPSFLSHLKLRYDFFELFDGIVTSGAEHIAKPESEIFEIMLNRFNLPPESCLFIDDSPANTATARELKMNTVTFKASGNCYQQIEDWITR